jgi:hypothetical protein
MTDKSVATVLEDTRSRLLKKLYKNEDLCNVVIALLGRLTIESHSFGGPQSIRLSDIQEHGNGEFRARISYAKPKLWLPSRPVAKNDLMDYMANKNIALAQVLYQNPGVSEFFQTLIGKIEQYSAFKSIPFYRLKVITGGAFISRDGELVIRVGKNALADIPKFS